MTPVFQRIIDPERGDCYRAAVASVLDLALDEVPEDINNGFTLEPFLRSRGLCALYLASYNLKPRPEPYASKEPWDARKFIRYDYAAGAIAIASVPSQKFPGKWHAVVVQFVLQLGGWVRCECIHDPNPGNAPYDMAVTELRSLTFFLAKPS